MGGLVEGFAANLSWQLRPCNVLVEGTSDVAFLWLANAAYHAEHNELLLDEAFGVLAAGKADDGGVDGLNRRLNAARQMADVDRSVDGRLRYRFIGLFDNDNAGRRAVEAACSFDRRLRRYADLFLLHPVMPLADGADHLTLRKRFESANTSYNKLDCEIEDLLPQRLIERFEGQRPGSVLEVVSQNGRSHYEFSREGKRALLEFVSREASLNDFRDMIGLIKALRNYFQLPTAHIKT